MHLIICMTCVNYLMGLEYPIPPVEKQVMPECYNRY